MTALAAESIQFTVDAPSVDSSEGLSRRLAELPGFRQTEEPGGTVVKLGNSALYRLLGAYLKTGRKYLPVTARIEKAGDRSSFVIRVSLTPLRSSLPRLSKEYEALDEAAAHIRSSLQVQ